MKRLWVYLVWGAVLFGAPAICLLAQDPPGAGKPEAASEISEAQRLVLKADLDRAIQLLKENQQVTFLNDYTPLDDLREMRSEKKDLNEVARRMQSNKRAGAELIALLQRARDGQFEGNDDEVNIVPVPSPDDLQPELIPVAQPLRKVTDLKGYGSDFPKALAAGIADLKAKKFGEFMGSMLPASEVGRLNQTDQLEMTASIFTLYPELSTAMIADLEAVAKLNSKVVGNLVQVTLKGDAPDAESREVRFQLSGGHWRFFDQALAMDDTVRPLLEGQAKFESILEPILVMERVRDHWRIKQWPKR